jgi:outer membrane protein OmpA-like peptidoglycan-associated protein
MLRAGMRFAPLLFLLAMSCAARPLKAPRVEDVETIDVTTDDVPLGTTKADVKLTTSDGTGLRLASMDARAVLYGPLAFTELHLTFTNPVARGLEGTFAITLPEGASVNRFAMRLPQGWQEGEVVERQTARTAFEAFVHRKVDPALLERDSGNVFRGRVFPILASQEKEIVIAYTQTFAGEDAYRLPLVGIPALDWLDARLYVPNRKKLFVMRRRAQAPDRDFVYSPPEGSPDAVHGGSWAVVREAAPPQVAGPIRTLAVAIDTSASRAKTLAADVVRVEAEVAKLHPGSVKIACFDQELEPVASFSDAAKRAAGGASNIGAALEWIRNSNADRALLVTDGHATLGLRDAALANEMKRLEAVLIEEPKRPLAFVESREAPANAVEAPPPLVERAVVEARIRKLERERVSAAPARAEMLRREIIDLSVRHRILTSLTAMVVLETEADYRRFNLPHDAMLDIPVVGPRGVEIVPRGGGHVLLPSSSGASPLVERTIDSDGDGIPDSVDRCPNEPETYNGFQDEDGCPDRGMVLIESDSIRILNRVQFENGSAALTADSKPVLDAIAEALAHHPEITLVDIQGHTDDRGDARANKLLSLARANAVRNALLARGVSPKRLVAQGFGGERPIESNLTAEGREWNRRVEFRIAQASERGPDPASLHGKQVPRGEPYSGLFAEIMRRPDATLSIAEEWTRSAPDDMLAWIAYGRALDAAQRPREAARAYGSVLDLAIRPEHRRIAGSWLASSHHPPALEMAIDAYRQALAERPDHPSSHHLLALALARAGHSNEAREIAAAGAQASFDDRRFPGAREVLQADAVPGKSSTRVTLTWETDESDLDLRFPGARVAGAPVDVRTGYGPESATIDRPASIEVHHVWGGSGFAFGTVSIVHPDAGIETRPFVIMTPGAAVSLGTVAGR